jgi:hypothetical protein
LVSPWCGAFLPVDGFCVGGHALEEIGGELGVGAAAAAEAELPEFCGGPVVVVWVPLLAVAEPGWPEQFYPADRVVVVVPAEDKEAEAK